MCGQQLPQEFVTQRMSQGVVDDLEAVEVEVEHRKLLIAPKLLHQRFHLLSQGNPVRQTGQRVMKRHM